MAPGHSSRATGHRRPAHRGRWLAVSLVVSAAVLSVLLALSTHLLGRPTAAHASTAPSGSRIPTAAAPAQGNPALDPRWARVLAAIDHRRMVAWQRCDPDLLASVYVAGSPVLARDRRALHGYQARGLRISGVDMHFSVVSVVRQRPGFARLFVVDRLGHAAVHTSTGLVEALPRDLPTRHRITLQLTDGQWRIAAITLA